jgi:hypothetical protein
MNNRGLPQPSSPKIIYTIRRNLLTADLKEESTPPKEDLSMSGKSSHFPGKLSPSSRFDEYKASVYSG